MRLRSKGGICVALVLALSLDFAAPIVAQTQDTDGREPTPTEIEAALGTLRADPNLATERKTRTLRWASKDEPDQKPPGFMEWIKNFFVWLGQLSRVLVWVVGGVLLLGLAIFLVQLFRGIRTYKKPAEATLPTHVRDLDIRPESLPDDIGKAALELWHRGEHRAALALLYRGLLSRLVHTHRVPIRDSSTEGDCLALAAKHLSRERSAFVGTLIRTWQRATYGAHDPESDAIEALCTGFDTALAPGPQGPAT